MSRPRDVSSTSVELSTLDVLLSILVPVAMVLAFAWWVEAQPPSRTTLSGGTIEVRENSTALLATITLCFAVVIFAVAVLLRRPWRRLALAALLSLMMGLLTGGLIASRMAVSGVMRFAPTEATIVAPPWMGGETRIKLMYSEIEWLRRRQIIRWERSWNPIRFAVAWHLGANPGWKKSEKDEYLIKKKGEDEQVVELGFMVRNGWHEIVESARVASVPVKPVERMTLTPSPEGPRD